MQTRNPQAMFEHLNRLGWILSASLLVVTSSPSGASTSPVAKPVPKGDRVLSIQANLGEEGDFGAIFAISRAAGSETQVLPLDWNELETAPGRFEPAPNFLAIANGFYPAHGTPIHLSIRPIHTNQKVVPADLADLPFDDPRVVRRFRQLLDWVAAQLPDVEVSSLAIGSEVDIHLWGDAERWRAWTAFYAEVAPHARQLFPGTLIGCETTHAAFTGADLARVRALHRHSDAIGVSYYPMKAGLEGARPPTSVHVDFRAIAAAVPAKPILYYQIGYPSSPALGSSLDHQAAFVEEAFVAWDTHADRIRLLSFQWMHETPEFGLDRFAAYYAFDSPSFRAFLGSLGFRTWSGEPKPAWHVFVREARRRGFGK